MLVVCLLQMVTRPQLTDLEGWLAEAGIFVVAVLLGSGIRIAMKSQKRNGVSKKEAMIILFFGFSLGFAANYAMLFYEWNVPRPLIVWAVSLLAEFILIWIEKRYPKLFDSIFEKVTQTKIKEDEPEEVNYEDEP